MKTDFKLVIPTPRRPIGRARNRLACRSRPGFSFAVRLCLILLVSLCATLRLASQAEMPGFSFDADTSETDLTTGENIRRGNARLAYGGAILSADEIRYNFRTKIAYARGNVILQQENRRMIAEEMTYRLADSSFDVKNLRLGVDPIYVSGSTVKGTPSEVIVEQATATFREPGAWTPTLRANRLTFRDDDQLELDGGRVGLGRHTLLPLPGFPIPIDQVFLRYLTLGGGYRRSLGAFFEIGVQLPVARGFEAGPAIGYYSNRGLLFGASGIYERRDGERHVSGAFRSGFIHDSGDKLRDVLDQRIQEDRGFVQWEHRQRLSNHLTLMADLGYWSDSAVLRDFRPEDFYPVQQPDTFAEATYVDDTFVVSAFARTNPNRYFRVQERLPELQFALLSRSLGSADLRLYQRGHLNLARLVENDPTTGPTLRSDRIDAYYGLTRPISPREWLTVKPVAGVQVTHYGRTLEESNGGDYTRTLGEVGFDADVRASATYAYQNKRWKVDGLRHLVTPRLSYRYIPKADRGRGRIPQIDRRAFSTYLQPLGLGDQRNVDELTATNTLRLRIDNTLQTRDPEYGSRDLVDFNLGADVRFERDVGARTLSDLHTELGLMPATWLRFDLYQRYSTQDGKLRELNTGLTVTNSEWWSLRLGTHYLENNIEEYVADGAFRIDERFEAFARMHYDSRQARFVQQTYGVRQTLDRLWTLTYGLNFYEGRRREGSFGFVVEIETAAF